MVDELFLNALSSRFHHLLTLLTIGDCGEPQYAADEMDCGLLLIRFLQWFCEGQFKKFQLCLLNNVHPSSLFAVHFFDQAH